MTLVVDSSVIVSILLEEEGCEIYQRALEEHPGAFLIAAPTVVEILIVLVHRTKRAANDVLATFLQGKPHKIVAFDERLVALAHDAFFHFGKKRHAANLNFGDCMVYALAKALDARLLFKGDDFAKTDVRSALS